jgi:RNA polymerase sigma factor (sigma-70 family)
MVDPKDHIGLACILSLPYARRQRIPVKDTEQFSDASIGLCEAAAAFDLERDCTFATFATKVIVNNQREWHTRRNIGVRAVNSDDGDLSYVLSNERPVCESIEHRELIQRLQIAISKLPADCFAVIRYCLSGFSCREIADLYGCKPWKIEARAARAYQLLAVAIAYGNIPEIRGKQKRSCSVQGCENPSRRHELCNKHYKQHRRKYDK